jgi:hypothetical protein
LLAVGELDVPVSVPLRGTSPWQAGFSVAVALCATNVLLQTHFRPGLSTAGLLPPSSVRCLLAVGELDVPVSVPLRGTSPWQAGFSVAVALCATNVLLQTHFKQ